MTELFPYMSVDGPDDASGDLSEEVDLASGGACAPDVEVDFASGVAAPASDPSLEVDVSRSLEVPGLLHII